jgi:predicted glycosyltransferase
MFVRSLCFAASLVAAPAALAQEVAPLAAPAVSFSDEQLRNFAKAVIELRALSNVYSPKLRAASTESAMQVRAEAKEKATAAMGKHMLTPETYRKIQDAALKDKALDSRISQHIVELAAAANK